MKKPKAILFDADGVIQKTSISWRKALGQFIPEPDQVDDFLADIFAAEKPCLTGHGDFENVISQVLQKWGIDDHNENVQAAREAGLHAEIFHMNEGADRLKNLFVKYGINIPSV